MPYFRNSSLITTQTIVGIINIQTAIPKPIFQSGIMPADASITPNTPTSPDVPIPPPTFSRPMRSPANRESPSSIPI